MGWITKGLLAGAAAAAVLSALMVMKQMMGLIPRLDLPKMISGMMGAVRPGRGARPRLATPQCRPRSLAKNALGPEHISLRLGADLDQAPGVETSC